ncbi:MAG: polysaccharide pyruvyl transferase family protein [Acidobacteriota bacterium]
MSRVGFLWDSLSANTGDQAIGLTMLRLARRAGLRGLDPVRIGEPLAGRYDMLVVGGGELLHPPGHGFYDLFRVPGEHVLSTVGTSGVVDASHLSSYRLVTVRSSADRDNLRGLSREVKVAPCLSVLFPGLAEDHPAAMERDSILVHLHAGAFLPSTAPTMVSMLRRLGRPVALLPFTPYIRDADIQAVLAAAADIAPPLAVAGPDQVFAAMRRAGAVVVASLHAAIFAYIAGVPFLAIPYVPKVRHFMAERGLEHRLLPDVLRLPERLHLLAADGVDWQATAAADVASAGAVVDEIFALVEDALARSGGGRAWGAAWREPACPERAHAETMGRIAEFGRRQAQVTADVLAGRHRLRRLIATGIRTVVKHVPAIRRLGWARAVWERWLVTHGC